METKFCPKCGATNAQESRFCTMCGTGFEKSGTKKTQTAVMNTLAKIKEWLSTKKAKRILIIAGIAIVVLFLFSPAFLRFQIQTGSWYEVDDDGDVSSLNTRFYSDGNTNDFIWEWEVLSDRTLVITTDGGFSGRADVTYYDYGEWYCTGLTLVIGEDYKFTRFPGIE